MVDKLTAEDHLKALDAGLKGPKTWQKAVAAGAGLLDVAGYAALFGGIGVGAREYGKIAKDYTDITQTVSKQYDMAGKAMLAEATLTDVAKSKEMWARILNPANFTFGNIKAAAADFAKAKPGWTAAILLGSTALGATTGYQTYMAYQNQADHEVAESLRELRSMHSVPGADKAATGQAILGDWTALIAKQAEAKSAGHEGQHR